MTQRDIDNEDVTSGRRTWAAAPNFVFNFGVAELFPEDLTSRRRGGGESDSWILTRPRDDL
jgi:hypothetical protein